MTFFKKRALSFREKFFQKHYSFPCLNIAQFLGALNDNIYKLLTIFFLISFLKMEKASAILSAVGALYVIPFLLFSSAAGILADKLSKQRLIVALKTFEIFLMAFALIAFLYKSALWSYILLFFLATHSALFGPSKYGIIPELVEKEQVAKANSIITGFTYLAIIIGTFLASFLTDFTGQNYVLCVCFCLLFAVLGFISSLGIKKTAPQRSSSKVHFFFLKEILKTILDCRKTPFLAPSLFGSAYFLFIGAFTQLNIIPFAIESLHLSEYAGGYLFLLTALGIVGGSFCAGKLLKKKIDLGLPCLMGILISLLFWGIWIFSSHLLMTCILLTFLGIAGGIFVICFDTFIQLTSSIQTRGQTIAAANFLSFLGVLIASFCLYLFGYWLGLSPALSFLCMGLLTLLMTFFLMARLFAVALPFLARLFPGKVEDPDKALQTARIWIMESFSFPLLWIAASKASSFEVLFKEKEMSFSSYLLKLAPNVHFLDKNVSLKEAVESAKAKAGENKTLYLFFQDPIFFEELQEKKGFFSRPEESLAFVSWKKSFTLELRKIF